MVIINLLLLMLPVLPWRASCEPANTKSLITKYEITVNASRVLYDSDRKLMSGWADEYQIRRLDVTMKYRMQMMKHQEHNFKSDGNVVWAECLFLHRKEIRRSITFYHDNEHECLRITTSKDTENKEHIEQLEKQIIKWIKGYRYVINQCHDENPGDQEMAEQCLIEYMQNEKYAEVIQRLMFLKQRAINDLYDYFNFSLIELEECLKTQLSIYLERIGSIVDTLNKYYIKINSVNT